MRGLVVLFVLVFGLNVYSQTAVLTNFRVEDSNKSRVYFDVSGDITGLTTQGFIISGKTITSINISGNYFTVSSAFNFWDNNTIRLENGNGIVSDFTLEYILNNIREPSSTDYTYYVDVATGSDSNNGTTESSAFRSISKALSLAKAGSTVWVKAGQYNTTSHIEIANDGTAEKPIKVIGYKSTPGDINKMYYSFTPGQPLPALRVAEMPTINGGNGSHFGFRGLEDDYIIFKNLQFTGLNYGIRMSRGIGTIVDNCLFKDNNSNNGGADYSGVGVMLGTVKLPSYTDTYNRIKNSIAINNAMEGLSIMGNHGLVDNCKVYCDNTTTLNLGTDYYIRIGGSNNIVRNSYAERANPSVQHDGHGIGVKSGEGSVFANSNYNLFQKNYSKGTRECYYVRNTKSDYNVFKDCEADGFGGISSSEDSYGMVFLSNSRHNIAERMFIQRQEIGVSFANGTESGNTDVIVLDNTLRNSIIKNSYRAIAVYNSDSDIIAPIRDNKIYNNIFYNAGGLVYSTGSFTNSNMQFTNNIFVGISNMGSSINGMVFEYNNFYNCWINSIGTNSLNVNPGFIDVTSGNFRLKSDSPMINKGKRIDNLKSDYEKNPRPQGSSHDLGAFEYHEKGTTSLKADAGKDQTICIGSSTTLTASGGSVYKWSTGATTKSITVSPGATTTYSVTVSEGSVSDTDEVLVTVNPLPIADAGADMTIESGQSTTLTATGGDTYLWSNGATTASITVNPTVTTTYEVTVNKNGCTSKDAVTVTVNGTVAPPATVTADAGKDQTMCIGNSITLTASGGSVYKWSTGATTKSITVSPGATTTYSVTVSEGSVSDTDEVLVTVNPLPIADAGADMTIESGQSTTLTATGGDTYLWSNGATTASITVNPTVTTTYEVTVNKNGCTSKDAVTVTVNGTVAPPATVTADAGKDQTMCIGNSITLTASGGSVYKWSTGATTKSITVSPNVTTTYSVTVSEGSVSDTDEVLVTVNPLPIADAGTDVTIESGQSTTLTATGGDIYLWSNGATTASITVNPTVTTTYEVTVNKNGCTSQDTVTVTVNTASVPPTTVTADAGKDQTICNGNSTTLTASGGSVYKWSTGATTKSITVSPGATTTYSVTVSEGSVSDTDEVLVTVNPLPIADAGSNKTIELGQSVELRATGGNTYLWSTGETTQSITVKPDKSTIYSVTVNQNGCSSGDSVQVTVNVPPPADANAGSDMTICKGESITLNGDGGATYSWSTGATSQNITVSPNRTTTYTLTANRGGTTSTDEVIVTVINCDLNNGVNNSVSGTTGNTATTNPTDQDDEQVLNKADFELTVYPNPTEGKLNVQTTVPIYNFNLVLMNINGNVIYSDEMDAAEDGINKEIDLSGFAKGVYLLQLYNAEESYVKKVIVI